jgi:hypothetical protein
MVRDIGWPGSETWSPAVRSPVAGWPGTNVKATSVHLRYPVERVEDVLVDEPFRIFLTPGRELE